MLRLIIQHAVTRDPLSALLSWHTCFVSLKSTTFGGSQTVFVEILQKFYPRDPSDHWHAAQMLFKLAEKMLSEDG